MPITVYTGPMFAEKTTQLISQYVKISNHPGNTVAMIKHDKDKIRYSPTFVKTHKEDDPGVLATHTISNLSVAVEDLLENFTHVFIDEGQFFPDLVPVCEKLANGHVDVYIALLSGTFQRLPWKPASDIFAVADEIHHLHALCFECGSKAPFTAKVTKGKLALESSSEIDVGGAEKYRPLCRSCFMAGVEDAKFDNE